MDKIIHKQEDKIIYYVCLTSAILLMCISFLMPPVGEIHPSVLKAVALLLGFAALAIVGKNLSDGKEVTYKHGETEVTIGDYEDE